MLLHICRLDVNLIRLTHFITLFSRKLLFGTRSDIAHREKINPKTITNNFSYPIRNTGNGCGRQLLAPQQSLKYSMLMFVENDVNLSLYHVVIEAFCECFHNLLNRYGIYRSSVTIDTLLLFNFTQSIHSNYNSAKLKKKSCSALPKKNLSSHLFFRVRSHESCRFVYAFSLQAAPEVAKASC